MKKIMPIFGAILLSSIILTSCGSSTENVDVCTCLTSPGDSDYMTENKDACRDAISQEIGVDNWEKVNFSQNPELSAKWDALVSRCM